MRILLPLFFFLIVTPVAGQSSKIQKLDWLVGTWMNPKNGVYETWGWTANGKALEGRGFEVYEGDTTLIETLSIRTEKGKLVYGATLPGRQEEVLFRISKLDATGFTCANPKHDFPKQIAYLLENAQQMRATIGDGRKSKEFTFKRLR
jgi:hypothetical protein